MKVGKYVLNSNLGVKQVDIYLIFMLAVTSLLQISSCKGSSNCVVGKRGSKLPPSLSL